MVKSKSLLETDSLRQTFPGGKKQKSIDRFYKKFRGEKIICAAPDFQQKSFRFL